MSVRYMYMINIIIIIIVIIIIIIIITILLSSHTCDGAEAVGQHCSQARLTGFRANRIIGWNNEGLPYVSWWCWSASG